ncbi:LuxR C-terminal-related transcriptional regulator [Catenulispora sp. EB89]|uniref:helix-turn-helix transcriptional regulator n=1 Tax=Catenulispora sp. EB89 TaxID=3156257 RepID=UPI003517BFB0
MTAKSRVLDHIRRAHADADTLLRDAARLLDAAAALALSLGDAGQAIELAERAYGLTGGAAQELRWLLSALVEGGSVRRAGALARRVDELEVAGLDPDELVVLRILLSQAAALGGDSAAGLAQADAARAIMIGSALDEATRSRLDLVHAELLRLGPAADGTASPRALAGHAMATASIHELPEVACESWLLIGLLARPHDLVESTGAFRAARATAQRHQLAFLRLRAQLELGIDEWLIGAGTGRLELVAAEASRSRCSAVQCTASGILALDRVLRGDHAAAAGLIGPAEAVAVQAGLVGQQRLLSLVDAVSAAHMDTDAEAAWRRFTTCGTGSGGGGSGIGGSSSSGGGSGSGGGSSSGGSGGSGGGGGTGGDGSGGRSSTGGDSGGSSEGGGGSSGDSGLTGHGLALARAISALIDEDRPAARDALAAAVGQPAGFLGLPPAWVGIDLLLAAVDGEPVGEPAEEILARAARAPLWNRLFLLLAGAVQLGRRGAGRAAATTVAAARTIGAPYRLAWNLGLRLVSEAALRDGWGEVAAWLREAGEYFQVHCHVAVSNACRTLLRAAGAPIPQWRSGRAEIPSRLRSLGVTVREYEVLTVLQAGGGNRRIAEVLHISPRTVEKHLASLLTKTGKRHRAELADLLARSG